VFLFLQKIIFFRNIVVPLVYILNSLETYSKSRFVKNTNEFDNTDAEGWLYSKYSDIK